MAEFGKIVCISIGYFASKESSFLQIKSFVDTDEKKVLLDFISAMNQIEAGFFTWSFAGHNIKEFHIPFICRRLLVNNIEIPAYLDFQNKKPWETMMLDSFHFWRFGDYKNYTSLKLLSKLLELPGFNDEMQGKEIGALYWVEDDIIRLENLKTISNHCSNNLVTMANVFLKYFRLPLMHREELVIDS